MDEFETKEEYLGAEPFDEPTRIASPPHVRILVGMVFIPALALALLWGFLSEIILGLVPSSGVAVARNLIYYSGLVCATVMGCGLLILIGGYFSRWRSTDREPEGSLPRQW